MKKFFVYLFLFLAIATLFVHAEEDSLGTVGSNDSPQEVNESDIFTPEERAQIASTEEKYEFQAEVNRLMDILINSLYTNRDIFIREVISNAADALDKIRFLSLTEPELLEDKPNLDIRVHWDKEKRLLTFIDSGIGMTKDELKKNLGIVAKSGTTDFIEAAKSGKDAVSLIGQFGVGFYSVYLVADKVTVTSKSPHDEQYIWESTAQGSYTISKDPRGNTLGRGTVVTLHLKKDADEFLNDKHLTDLVTRYSQFINFPIYIATKKTVTEEVEIEEPTPSEVDSNDDDLVVNEDEDKPKKTQKVTRDVIEDVQVNSVKALWTRSASEVTDDEYADFFKALTKDRHGYLTKNHFSAEGDISFKSLIFVPNKAEAGLYDRYYESPNGIKLYVRRVLISDDFKDFLPRYMNFVKGLVDSDDLPLNVNREMLAHNRVLKVMSKKVVRKVLDVLRGLANDEQREIEEYNDAVQEYELAKVDDPEVVLDAKEPERLYTSFWKEFGKSIKLGVLDDHANKIALSRLLRFKSTMTKDDEYVSLDEYLERKKDSQETIFYLTGESLETLKSSPFVTRAKKLGIEVLLLDDPLDEYLVQSLTEYDGTPLQSLSRDGVKLGGELPNLLKQQEKDFGHLISFLTNVYRAHKIEKVVLSHRLGDSPMVAVSGQYGWTANMERIMKSQAFADKGQHAYMLSRKTIEINPFHPVIVSLSKLVGEDKDKAEELATLLYDSALITSGFGLSEPEEFAKRVLGVIARSLDVDASAEVIEPTEDIEPPASLDDDGDDAHNLDGDIIDVDATVQPTKVDLDSNAIKIDLGNIGGGADKDEL